MQATAILDDVSKSKMRQMDRLWMDNRRLWHDVQYFRNQSRMYKSHLDRLSKKKKNKKNKKKEPIPELLSPVVDFFKGMKTIDDLMKLEDKPWRNVQHPKLEALYSILEPMKKLNSLVGLHELKAKIFQMVLYQMFHKIAGLRPTEMQNIIITGPPGVGKSALIKIIANIFVKSGYLSKDVIIEGNRTNMIGRYLGHTAVQTKELLQQAKGGVFVIDEAYSLGSSDGKDSFAKEAIDTLNQFMTENTDTLVILAGYEDNITECVLNQNMGLDRRFPIRLKIEGYSKDDLLRIFQLKCRENNIKTENVGSFIKQNSAVFKFFAADMETLLMLAKYNAVSRMWASEEVQITLNLQDITVAFKQLETTRESNVSLSMYL
jgi:SpoVK/Ycf46/Vps4 family AAA+-type ATPase